MCQFHSICITACFRVQVAGWPPQWMVACWDITVRVCCCNVGYLTVATAKSSLVSGSPCWLTHGTSIHTSNFLSTGMANRAWLTPTGQAILLTSWLFSASSMMVLNSTQWKSVLLSINSLSPILYSALVDISISGFSPIICFLSLC